MIPENLREEWAREVERQELLFLACNGVRHAHRSDEGGHAR